MYKRYRKVVLTLVSLVALILSACSATAPAATGQTGGTLGVLEIAGYDVGGYSPSTLNVDQPGRYTIKFMNEGTTKHDVVFSNGVRVAAEGGKTGEVALDVPATGLTFASELPGHREAGMHGVVTVGGQAVVQGGATHGGDNGHAAAAAPVSDELLGEIEIRSFEMGFNPTNLSVEKPGRYTVKLINDGALPHDITFPDGTKIYADAGQTTTGEVVIPEGGYEFICSIPGHAAAGMKGKVAVGSGGDAALQDEQEGHYAGEGGVAPKADTLPDPNAPEYTHYEPKAPAQPTESGKVHEITLETIEKEMVVADGFVQKVWTFGGTVPGPVLRVRVGDTVRIKLVNPSNSELPHSIDFHSSMVAWNDEMTSIKPGEDKIYEWKAEYAGIYMYHCGTPPALHHISNGMYGMVIVEPEEGLEPVDQEFALVQSEWYLGPQKGLSSLEKATVGAPAPDYVMFNGVANQYQDHPIQINTNERVRVFVLNAGPSIDSAFHIVGTIFDRVIKEGVELEVGNKGNWGSQVVDLAPAQGAMVEFHMAEDGLYPIVTHAFNFTGRGALGLFKAGTGGAMPAGGH